MTYHGGVRDSIKNAFNYAAENQRWRKLKMLGAFKKKRYWLYRPREDKMKDPRYVAVVEMNKRHGISPGHASKKNAASRYKRNCKRGKVSLAKITMPMAPEE